MMKDRDALEAERLHIRTQPRFDDFGQIEIVGAGVFSALRQDSRGAAQYLQVVGDADIVQ